MEIKMHDLIKAGAHFGHKTNLWNPKMKKYLFGERNKLHIINLDLTLLALNKVSFYIKNFINSTNIMFVGTKQVASKIIEEEAIRVNKPYVNHRWIGGMLTNNQTILNSIQNLNNLELMEKDGTFDKLTKKEILKLSREKKKLEFYVGGIKNMKNLPNAIFVIDVNNERIAIKEANKLNIPVIGVVDSNSDPSGVNYVIPGNDDSFNAIKIYTKFIANAIAPKPAQHIIK
ncbi:30S ribosomal protein S2 [Candidatus Johnevansia muelleri]|uniref:Small ribosomal subunit protein uS2 n=1 Tax=Candidatus Johnevansia muelleri TaxID=1495769 RepID=A0A078KAW5_9GAMM|nr:30S ribosomal protein S2 [Candidatus Evansia muelleri]